MKDLNLQKNFHTLQVTTSNKHFMDTLYELIDYCNIVNPAGAFMLVGGWGCGKTYLIENQLRKKLLNCIIIRVSLFGITDLGDVEKEIKSQWLQEEINRLGEKKTGKRFSHSAVDKIQHIGKGALYLIKKFVPQEWQKYVSLDVTDFIPVFNKIGDKRVVLVFDDLERAVSLDPVEILGCMNEYVENLHFPVIIVANEDAIYGNPKAKYKQLEKTGKGYQHSECLKNVVRRMGNLPNENNSHSNTIVAVDGTANEPTKFQLTYREIKEKRVQRTVKCIPDYGSIIPNIIEGLSVDGDYKKFLSSDTAEICKLFTGAYIANGCLVPPRNLRSLKCAFQDFERVYEAINEIGLDVDESEEKKILKKFFHSFTAFMILARADLITDSPFPDDIPNQLYPKYYNSDYIFESEKKWIKNGDWDKEGFRLGLEKRKAQQRAVTPVEKLRSYRFFDLDEDEINQGWYEYLSLAYNSKLSLDEYITLICHSFSARFCGFELPEAIDWDQVDNGINHKIDVLINSNVEDSHIHRGISDDIIKDLSKEEFEAFNLISDSRSSRKVVLERNRKLYIEAMQSEKGDISSLEDKILQSFDDEMVEVTFSRFKTLDNMDKALLYSEFYRIWDGKSGIREADHKSVVQGLQNLKNKLADYEKDCQDQKIALWHTKKFEEELADLIAEWDKSVKPTDNT